MQALFAPRVLGGVLAGVLLCTVALRLQPQWLDLEARRRGAAAKLRRPAGQRCGSGHAAGQFAPARPQLTVKLLQPLQVPEGQVAQLWALPRDGAPFLVGVVPARGSATLALTDSAEKLFFTVAKPA